MYYRYDPYWRPYGGGYYGRYGHGHGYGYGYPGYPYSNIYTPYSPLPYLLPYDSLPYYLNQPALLPPPPPPPTPLQTAYSTNYSY
jgi:hypothetical protein